MADGLNFVAPDFGKSPVDFFKEVKTELTKVSWPKRPEVVRLTIVVIAASVAVGVYLGGLDYLFTKILEIILKR